MRGLIQTLFLVYCFASCTTTEEIPLTSLINESYVIRGVPYGSESRQFLDLYKAKSDCPTPIYFDAHGNGGTTAMPAATIAALHAQGISVIAWESLTSVNSTSEVETGWNDAELMFQWIQGNAANYNLDPNNIIIGGSSRGSILSWKYGHSGHPGIKGLYMYNALPSSVWALPSWWYPPNEVTSASPPIYFVYRREPGSSMHPTDPDFHDPNNGTTIINTYQTLGIGDRTRLEHSIGTSGNTDKYQFLVDFALSVLDTCP